MEPSTLSGYAEAASAELDASSLLVCPCCGSKLVEMGGIVRCRLCQFAFCHACGDELPE